MRSGSCWFRSWGLMAVVAMGLGCSGDDLGIGLHNQEVCSFNSRTSHLGCFCWACALLASPPRRNGPLDQPCSHPQCVGSFQGGLEVPSPGHHSLTTLCLGSNISPAGPGPTATLTSPDPFLALGLYPEVSSPSSWTPARTQVTCPKLSALPAVSGSLLPLPATLQMLSPPPLLV